MCRGASSMSDQHVRSGSEQGGHREIFVQLFPVDPDSPSNETPPGTVRRRCVTQMWKPLKWHPDFTTIKQPNVQGGVSEPHVRRQRESLTISY